MCVWLKANGVLYMYLYKTFECAGTSRTGHKDRRANVYKIKNKTKLSNLTIKIQRSRSIRQADN